MTPAQPEALRIAELPNSHAKNGTCTNCDEEREAATELLRLHAENKALRASHGLAPSGATEMENLQRTAVGWQERALRAERNWAVCRRWAIAGGAPVEKLGDDPDQPLPPAPGPADGESNV